MGDIILKLKPQVAQALGTANRSGASELLRTLRECGAKLGPPTGSVGETALYFSVVGVAPDAVPEVLGRLRSVEGVEAAYAKPADEVP